jgi:hypothetical protein
MTKLEAKKLALEKLCYYLEHPEVKRKEDLPQELFDRIKNLMNYCPMCELFYIKGCPECPLRTKRMRRCNDHRKTSMQKNIAILQEWNVS